jgi:hypothetical protein
VTPRQISSSQQLYGLNKAKLEEIHVFLREPESGTAGQQE